MITFLIAYGIYALAVLLVFRLCRGARGGMEIETIKAIAELKEDIRQLVRVQQIQTSIFLSMMGIVLELTQVAPKNSPEDFAHINKIRDEFGISLEKIKSLSERIDELESRIHKPTGILSDVFNKL